MFGFGNKDYNNMNDKTRKEIVAWAKTWDNEQCQKCGGSFTELEIQEQIKIEMGGKPRILPVFTVDHRDGDSSHNDGYIDVDELSKPLSYGSQKPIHNRVHHKYGNCRRLCWPCNRIAGILTRKTIGTATATREKQDRVNNEQIFIFECENQINEREHVCYKAMTKAGKNICDSSEITCARYLDTEIRTPENPRAKFQQFPYTCEGKFCNGSHVCWFGVKPSIVIEQERIQHEREWERQYTLPFEGSEQTMRVTQFERATGMKWIPKEEFIKARLKLDW